MMNSRTAHGSIVKRFLIIFIPLSFAIILASRGLYYLQHVKTRQDILRAQEAYSQKLKGQFVKIRLQSIISDIRIIAQHKQLIDILRGTKDQSDFADELMQFSKYKGIYDQIRVINKAGMEVLRVNLQGDKPVLIPTNELQSKVNRYYFKAILNLAKGEIYMSRFDLNIEHGQIERPFKPTIRFGMPLFDQNGQKRGILVLNYLGNNLLQELDQLSSNSPGQFMLLNSDGYWLRGKTPDMDWGFMLPNRSDLTMRQKDSELWQYIIRNNSGQLMTSAGLTTFEKIYPLRAGLVSSAEPPNGPQGSTHYLTAKDRFWVILSQILPGELYKQNSSFIAALVLSDLLLLALLGLIAWKLIVAREKRHQAEEALRILNSDLEDKVKERTRELSDTNDMLQREIEEHHKAISEKNKIEAQLRQAQKMEAIGTLAGGVAHDFNNILTPILANTQLLAMQMDDNDPNQCALLEINMAANRAKELVQQILTFSRKTEGELTPLQLQTTVKDALKLLRASLPATIETKTDLDPDCRAVLADPTQIHQVIMNLCTNAYHAMRDQGGTLSLSLYETNIGPEDYKTHFELIPGTYLKLEISDTGCGIPRELQEKIFEPYFTTKETGEGTGLGLSMVHAIVKKLQGHVTVYSEPGTGTTFRIYLPAIDTNHDGTSKPVHKEVAGGKEHILIVDDEDLVRRVESRILDKYGYLTTVAESGNEALRIFQKTPEAFDLIITDMTMPGISGMALIEAIHEVHPELPVILCTGYSETINAETAKSLGISRFLTKPATVETLAQTVREALDE